MGYTFSEKGIFWPVANLRVYHLNGLLLSFQKPLNLDHQNSSYRADSSSLKMKGTACTIAHILDGPDVAECVCVSCLGSPPHTSSTLNSCT